MTKRISLWLSYLALVALMLPSPIVRSDLGRYNPVDNLGGLIGNQVPMYTVQGDSDTVVPLELNSGLLKQRYEAGGGSIIVKVIQGEGHKVSTSFFECQELVDFAITKARK